MIGARSSLSYLLFPILIGPFLTLSCSKKEASPPQSTAEAEGADPLLSYQWHLRNTGQLGGSSGEDINVQTTWGQGNYGNGVNIMVVDDGLEAAHPDINKNFSSSCSYNYTDNTHNPTGSSAIHGTSVGGVICARNNNAIGVSGVAPRCHMCAVNLLDGRNATANNIADALTRNISSISVSNNSWGFQDGLGTFNPRQSYWTSAIDTGLATGRSGLGTIYLWAAGNGGTSEVDNSNYDGYANSRGVMAICAVGDRGLRASYSEQGANLWLCAHSLGSSGNAITTTDLVGGSSGTNKSSSSSDLADKDYTNQFNGTSAATPVVAGVVGLMLKANPQLGWRDVRIILAKTARKNDATDSDWSNNGASSPYSINHKYGFGVVDADAAVSSALSWSNVGTLNTQTVSSSTLNTAIPDADATGISHTLTVSGSSVSSIEWVTVTVNLTHDDWGDLDITLERTINSVTITDTLAKAHNCIDPSFLVTTECANSSNTWDFGNARHLGEPADGTWTLTVKDRTSANSGTLNSWSLTFYGE